MPIRSLLRRQQTPAMTAASEPEEPGDREHAAQADADADEVGDAADDQASAVAGAIHDRTVPGVPRLAIQPQPRPLT